MAHRLPNASVAPSGPAGAGGGTVATPPVGYIVLADYNRDGAVTGSGVLATAAHEEWFQRVIRPGAILMPNLDIDDPARIPAVAAGAAPGSLAAQRDSIISTFSATDDDHAVVRVVPPVPNSSGATTVTLRMEREDEARVRIYQHSPGVAGTQIFGRGSAHTHGPLTLPAPSVALDLRVDALAFAGTPRFASPTGAAPDGPLGYGYQHPTGHSSGALFSSRAPGEVWIELVHSDSRGHTVMREVALFTIAPFMLLSNLRPVERAYAVYFAGSNHNFIYELAEALAVAIHSPAPNADTSVPFTPSVRTDTTAFYIIDGGRYNDEWIQDEIEIGYARSPHATMHVTLHCARQRELWAFVHQELIGERAGARGGMGLMNGVASPGGAAVAGDSVEYGGNIEVSAPVVTTTPVLHSSRRAGPHVPAHPIAPFGKIIIGDSSARSIRSELRRFLIAQHVQPVLPIDTSWLSVGHVDEILSVVPSTSAPGHKLLFASVNAMDALLTHLLAAPSTPTNFHRGRFRDRHLPPGAASPFYAELVGFDLNTGDVGRLNRRIATDHLTPIERRLRAGLALGAHDILPIPVYFETPATGAGAHRTAALTLGMVNMLVVGHHVMVPKPNGPRLPAPQATDVVRGALGTLSLASIASGMPAVLPAPSGHTYWAAPGETLDRIAQYFASSPDRPNAIDAIKGTAGLSAANGAAALAMKSAIEAANPALMAMPNFGLSASRWRRVVIPEPTVDILEAYMTVLLGSIGLTVHFIDDWFYHDGEGEVHCGTNARRTPDPAMRWWNAYDPTHDVSYSV